MCLFLLLLLCIRCLCFLTYIFVWLMNRWLDSKKGNVKYKYLTLPNPFRPTIPDHQITNYPTMKKLLSSRTIPAVEGGKTQKQKRCIEYICSQLRTHSIQTSITCSPSSHNSKSKRRTN